MNFDSAKSILQTFGNLVHKLKVSFEQIDAAEGREIVKHINEYCANSLTQLELNSCKGNILDDLKSTFINLKTFVFSSSETNNFQIKPHATKLSRLFPNLNSLKLGFTKISHWAIIVGKFPHLNFLDLTPPNKETQNVIDNNLAANLIRKNAHIETLIVNEYTMMLLKNVSDFLPKLQNLTLNMFSKDCLNYDGKPIQFNTVQHLSIQSESYGLPTEISFTQLQRLNLDVARSTDDKWLQFINKQVNKNIDDFEMIAKNLPEKQFLAIPNELTNLKTVVVKCPREFSADELNSFVLECKLMTNLKMKMTLQTSSESEFLTILDHFDRLTNWKIDVTFLGAKQTHMTFVK